MFLKNQRTGELLRVLDPNDLFNLNHKQVCGCYQGGEEEQDAEMCNKSDLVFLSGEQLPRCWLDPHYRDGQIRGMK